MKIPQRVIITIILNLIVICVVIEVFGILTQNTLASIFPPIIAAGSLVLAVINHFSPSRTGGSSTAPPIILRQPTIKRRTFIAVLTGLAVVDIGIVWLALFSKSHVTFSFPSNSTLTPTLLPLPQGTLLYRYGEHTGPVSSIAWSPDSKRIASASEDKTVQVWDAMNGGDAFTYHGYDGPVSSVAWSPDGKRIASVGGGNIGSGNIQIWNAVSGETIFKYHDSYVYSAVWSPDSKRIALVSGWSNVVVGEVDLGKFVFSSNIQSASANDSYGVLAVAWSPDGTYLALAVGDGTMQVCNAADGSHIYTSQGHIGRVSAVAWSYDSKHIATAGEDRTVQVWDAISGSHLLTYRGHTDLVRAVAWSPDGRRIASASNDKTVQVWDATNGGDAFTYHRHTGLVSSVAWSPDGRRIASGSWDITVQVWSAE